MTLTLTPSGASGSAARVDVSRSNCNRSGCRRLDADEEAVREVSLELGAEDLVGRRLDVVLDALELETFRLAIVERVAGAVVVIARLADGAHADHVPPVGLQVEVRYGHLFHAVGRE